MSSRAGRDRPSHLALVLATLVVTAVLAGLLGVLPTTPAPASAASTRTQSAWLLPGTGTGTGERVRLGYVRVVRPGTYQAHLTTRVTDRSADPVQLVSVSLMCKEGSTVRDQIGAAANVVRGETFTLTARVYFRVRERAACFAYGTTTGLKPTSASRWGRRVHTRSTVTISDPVPGSTRESPRFVRDDAERGYAGRSRVSRPGVTTRTGVLGLRARPGSRALVTGHAYLTTCTAVGGSRDQTTAGRHLCTPTLVRRIASGSLVRLRLVVRQYSPGGRVCATTVVPGSTTRVRIRATRHHLPVAVHGTVRLRGTGTWCGSRARAWTEVRVLGGPSVVVHFPSTVTAFRPR